MAETPEPRVAGPIVRLGVNLAPDVAEVLKKWIELHGYNATDGIRAMIILCARMDGIVSEDFPIAVARR